VFNEEFKLFQNGGVTSMARIGYSQGNQRVRL